MNILKMIVFSSIVFFLVVGVSSAEDLNSSDGLISQEGDGSFSDLQNLINQAPENSTITLSRDYISNNGDFSEGIVINKPLSINGNNHVIDAKSKSRIFNIVSSDVVLNDIVFVNGKTNLNGGAIYYSQGGTINNCTFKNNIAHYGGAVFSRHSSLINNSVFADNSAVSGGAIYQYESNVYDSRFVNNFADKFGGAIYQTDSNVYSSTFEGNNVPFENFMDYPDTIYGYGGAIFQKSSNVSDSTFINNNGFNGGAIQQVGSNVFNSVFSGNNAVDAGAVKQYGNSTIHNSTFADNSALANGGAVQQMEGSEVYSSSFLRNSASYGGAIDQSEYSNVYDSAFEDNSAEYYGGAIDQSQGSNVYGSSFVNNYAKQHGGAIAQRDDSDAYDCTFEGNSAGYGCDNICNLSNHTDFIQSDDPIDDDPFYASGTDDDYEARDADDKLIDAEGKNSTGNPLGLFTLCLFVLVATIRKNI